MNETDAAQHTLQVWLLMAAGGAVFGALGQAVRIVPGLYKLSQETRDAASDKTFRWQVVAMSLAFGAVAGALAALATGATMFDPQGVAKPVQFSVVAGLMAAGYAGADFIEAFAGKHLANRAGTPGATATDPATTTAAAGGALG